jgi:DNA-directed RNA polymerase specialized sigma24 family protein
MTQPTFKSLAQAVEVLYEELRRHVQRRIGSHTFAEDVVQETWIRASTTGAAHGEWLQSESWSGTKSIGIHSK